MSTERTISEEAARAIWRRAAHLQAQVVVSPRGVVQMDDELALEGGATAFAFSTERFGSGRGVALVAVRVELARRRALLRRLFSQRTASVLA